MMTWKRIVYTTTTICGYYTLLFVWTAPRTTSATAAYSENNSTTTTTTTTTTSTSRRRHRYHPASWFVKKNNDLLEQQQQQHYSRYIGLYQSVSSSRNQHDSPVKQQQQTQRRQGPPPYHRFPKPKSKEYRQHVDHQQQQQQQQETTSTTIQTSRRGGAVRNLQKAAAAAATTTATVVSNIFDSHPGPQSRLEEEQQHVHDILAQQQQQELQQHTQSQETIQEQQPAKQQQQQQTKEQQKQQQQQQQTKEKQRYRRVVIEGSTPALFFCPTCKETLQMEQDIIWQAIQDKYNAGNINNNNNNEQQQQQKQKQKQIAVATLVRAKQDLINALFVKIPILSIPDSTTTTNKNNDNVRNLQQQQQQQQYIQLNNRLDLENNDQAIDERVNDDTQIVDLWLQSLPGVVRVSPSQDYQASNMEMNHYHIDSIDIVLGNNNNIYNAKNTANVEQGHEERGEEQEEFHEDDIMKQDYDSEALYPTMYEVADYLGSRTVSESNLNCLTGRGIRVAVLDTGVDYTHSVFGGIGTTLAYQQAYGAARNASENTERQSYFPTSTVVAGIDYVGDGEELISISDLHPDADPIDSPLGHGTKVASAIVATAPNVELIAIKVCSNIGSCPDFSMVDGLEYAIRQGARIANLSLGRWYTTSYYSVTAKAIEDAFQLGLTTIVAAGNEDNVPWVIGGISAVPNAITIGSTLAKASTSSMDARSNVGTGTMAAYSSRGPGSNNMIKPDLSAPGGTILLARSGSGRGGVVAQGTSFAAPFVAGAVALLMEKCGPDTCSPFSIKAILMNTAKRTTRYHEDDEELLAPVSWVGSGEMDIEKAVQADFYAYSLEDVQPSLSLGLHNVVEDIVMTRTIRIVNMQGSPAHDLEVSYQFRDPEDERSGAMTIHIADTTVSLASSSDCNSVSINQVDVSIEFRIHASNVPSNHMTASGMSGNNPAHLDSNEFDGWIVIRSNNNNDKDISLPFLALLRAASHVTVGNPILPEIKSSPQFIPVNIINTGVGVAQIDSYELLHVSEDDPESARGSGLPSADFRFVGYQTRKVDEPNCQYIIEFAFTLWEAEQRPVNTQHEVRIDVDGDFKADFILANRAQQYHQTLYSECRIQDTITGEWKCTGFPPDHSTNTGNTIIRACSDDLGITAPATLNVGFSSVAFPAVTITADSSPAVRITVPATSLAAPSYDIAPGDTLSHIMVTGATNVRSSLGLLLITNAFRSASSTGAATRETEAIALTFDGVKLPREITLDVLLFPVATKLHGPDCGWRDASSRRSEGGQCPSNTITSRQRFLQPMSGSNNTAASVHLFHENNPDNHDRHRRRIQSNAEACPQRVIPRAQLATPMPSQEPSMTGAPTIKQTMAPSITPRPTQSPTEWKPPPPQLSEALQHNLVPEAPTPAPVTSSPVHLVNNLDPIPQNSQPDGNEDGDGEQSETPYMPEGWVIGEEDISSASAAVSTHTTRSLLTISGLFVLTLFII